MKKSKSGKEMRKYSSAEGRVVVYKSLVFLKKWHLSKDLKEKKEQATGQGYIWRRNVSIRENDRRKVSMVPSLQWPHYPHPV